MQCFARMSTHATSLAGRVGASLARGSDSGTGRPDRPHFTRYARATRADALKKAVARLFGIGVSQRVAGVDLMQRLLETCAAKGYHPYFLGATEKALSGALHNLRIRFPNLEIAGAQHGYYPRESEADVVAAIRASGADCLFIGMPTPHKERFLAAHRDTISVPFIMGVGGGIDIIAQITKRAPVWMQRVGLEWLYRVMQEPRRMWKRYLTTNMAFAAIIAKAAFRRL